MVSVKFNLNFEWWTKSSYFKGLQFSYFNNLLTVIGQCELRGNRNGDVQGKHRCPRKSENVKPNIHIFSLLSELRFSCCSIRFCIFSMKQRLLNICLCVRELRYPHKTNIQRTLFRKFIGHKKKRRIEIPFYYCITIQYSILSKVLTIWHFNLNLK